jgi:segregation and condensation protein A
MNYKIKLDIFEGPLDLLLYLIKKNDMDIINIPIVEITDQYMAFIDLMKMLDLDTVGDFLVMAATLMQIKSRMLLPPDPSEIEEEEDDPRDELVKRLQEYKRFKEIADVLKEKETERKQLFSRQYEEETLKKFKKDAKEVYFEANLFDLINAFSAALQKVPEEIIHEIIKEEYTVEKKIHDILHVLLKQQSIRLNELFEQSHSKMEVVVTFLAVLELIRLKEIKAIQKRAFSEIEILRNKDNIIPIEK